MSREQPSATVSIEQVTQSIRVFRGHKVLLDAELAELYGVPTKRLNEQVKRNASRFPDDFLFRLTGAEVEALNRSQFQAVSQFTALTAWSCDLIAARGSQSTDVSADYARSPSAA
jgi:hypothetical protein